MNTIVTSCTCTRHHKHTPSSTAKKSAVFSFGSGESWGAVTVPAGASNKALEAHFSVADKNTAFKLRSSGLDGDVILKDVVFNKCSGMACSNKCHHSPASNAPMFLDCCNACLVRMHHPHLLKHSFDCLRDGVQRRVYRCYLAVDSPWPTQRASLLRQGTTSQVLQAHYVLHLRSQQWRVRVLHGNLQRRRLSHSLQHLQNEHRLRRR